MKVLKFGGSCLGDIKDIERTVNIIKSTEKPIVVLSAFKGVTDELLLQSKNALNGFFDMKKIKEMHYSLLKNLSPEIKKETEEKLKNLFEELEHILLGISYLRELTPATKDKVQSFGERLIIHVISAYLNERGVKAVPLSDKEAGIITDTNFNNANILEKSAELIREKIGSIEEVPVIAGFVGRSEDGCITTLGRGGSDYTATFIGSVLNCEVILLKDVDGLMTADPKLVLDAKVLKSIEFLDALELAHYGSKVIFTKAILPAIKSQIPLLIKNFHGEHPGTLICNKSDTSIVISSVKNAEIINLFSYSANMMKVFSELLSEFADLNIYPLFIVESSSCGEISIVVEESRREDVERLVKKIEKDVIVEVKKNLSVISVIGSTMKGRIGTAASVFDCLAEKQINVIAISQSASEKSISVIVDKENLKLATQALHKKFVG